MRSVTRSALAGITLYVTLLCPALAATQYQKWLTESYPPDGPGAAAIVVKNNKVLFRGAAGLAEIELGVPLTPDSVFRLGSITKQFTAAGILLLEEQSKLSVTDNINKYLPDYPTHGYEITIEHLLTHTSGIANYTDIAGYIDNGSIRKDLSTEELVAVFANLPMDFAPGAEWRYSNSGYVLLGAIIEKVSGQSYAEFMQTAIFDKLGMTHTYYGGLQIIPKRALGYQGTAGSYTNATFISMTQPHAAGSLLSNVDDLSKWTNALFNGELLSSASLEKMTTNHKLNNDELTNYGYGFAVAERFGEQEIAHNGGINGFSTAGVWLPKQKIYAAVLSNNPDTPGPDFLAARMAFDAAGAKLPKMVAIKADPESFSEYVGVYQINPDETRSVIARDGKLYTQRSGGPSEIVASEKDQFFYPGSFTHLTFNRDDGGKVIGMNMYHGGIDKAEPAERISDTIQETPEAAKVSPEVYDLLDGTYELAPGANLRVRRDGGRLTVQMTGQPEFEAFPMAPMRYFLKVVDAQIEFTAGDDGRATRLVIYQGGGETPASRVD